jgi:hypothetical protein
MRKNSTPVYSTSIHQPSSVSAEMNPSQETLKNIMQFASAYRVEKVPKDRYIEYFLN